MKGMRPLTNAEILLVSDCFEGVYEIRNRSLFMLGVSTGGRISELLSLKIEDVYKGDDPLTDIYFNKDIVKGKELARTVPVNGDGRFAIRELMAHYKDNLTDDPSLPFFQSRNGLSAMDRRTAHVILKEAFENAGLNGKLATHSMRKSFAQRLYTLTGDIFVIKEMLGHKSVDTTQKYIGVNYSSVREACDAMAVMNNETVNLTPIYRCSDEELLLEVYKRGLIINNKENPNNGNNEC